MRVGIVGSRKCDGLTLERVISMIPSECTLIVSGGAVGVDTFAREASKVLGIELVEFLPDYDKYGKTAPLVRNITISQNIDLLIAFWDTKSRGTYHIIMSCLNIDVPVQIKSINKSLDLF